MCANTAVQRLWQEAQPLMLLRGDMVIKTCAGCASDGYVAGADLVLCICQRFDSLSNHTPLSACIEPMPAQLILYLPTELSCLYTHRGFQWHLPDLA